MYDQAAEEQLVAAGFAFQRFPVMYSDFVMIDPVAHPAQLKGNVFAKTFKKLNCSNVSFDSRGDNSGTHTAEKRDWKTAGFDTSAGKTPLANYWPAVVKLDLRRTWQQVLALMCWLIGGPTGSRKPNLPKRKKFVDWVTSPAGWSGITGFKINGQ